MKPNLYDLNAADCVTALSNRHLLAIHLRIFMLCAAPYSRLQSQPVLAFPADERSSGPEINVYSGDL